MLERTTSIAVIHAPFLRFMHNFSNRLFIYKTDTVQGTILVYITMYGPLVFVVVFKTDYCIILVRIRARHDTNVCWTVPPIFVVHVSVWPVNQKAEFEISPLQLTVRVSKLQQRTQPEANDKPNVDVQCRVIINDQSRAVVRRLDINDCSQIS